MKKHEPLSSAKASIGLLIVGIVGVLFWKFQENQNYFFDDLNALRNYVLFSIIAGALLLVLFYHVSQTTHPKSSVKAAKTSKKKKK
jgi:hypothetical protein